MKKKVLSLALALCLCMGLTVPAHAAGETVTAGSSIATVTITNVLRVERGIYQSYGGALSFNPIDPYPCTFYVVGDEGADVTVTLKDGCSGGFSASKVTDDGVIDTQGEGSWGDITGVTQKFHFSGDEMINYADVRVITESTFKRLVPYTAETPKCADWAKENIVKAIGGGLNPYWNYYWTDMNGAMTRFEFTMVALRLCQAMGMDTRPAGGYDSIANPFTDISDSYLRDDVSGFGSDVKNAYRLGIINGTSATTFSPESTLTREQAATILANVWTVLGHEVPAATATTFADDGAIGSWAKSGVAFMAEKGIVGGVGDNKFAPQQTLSIQEAMTMAVRMLENLK